VGNPKDGKQLHICFADYEKAFDRVDWSILMTALKRIGVDCREIETGDMIKNLIIHRPEGNGQTRKCLLTTGAGVTNLNEPPSSFLLPPIIAG